MNVLDSGATRVDPAWWQLPELRDPLAGHDIGAVYRFLRSRGFSQTRIAALTGQNQSEVSAILTHDRQVSAYDVLARIADGLAIPRGMMGLAFSASVTTVEGDRCPGSVEEQAMKRRDVFGIAAKLTVGAGLTAVERAVLSEPVGASPVPARIGLADVRRVEETTRSLMAQDKTFGGGSCREAVLGHLNWAERLRNATASDTVRQALDAALARLQNLAGWTSEDLCLPGAAERCYLRSLESARLAEQPVFAAHNLNRLGCLHSEAGRFRDALQMSQLGAMPAQEAASSGMLARLALSEAMTHGALGSVEEVRRALRRAEEDYARAQLAPDHWLVGTVVLPDRSDLPASRAFAYSRLAEHDRRFAETAVADMTEALAIRDPGRARAALLARITLATDQYRCGEVGLANTTTERVLVSIGQVSSRRSARKLSELGVEIRRHTTDSTALDLAHRITAAA